MRIPHPLRRFVLAGTPPTVPGGTPEFDRLVAYVYRHFDDPQRVIAALRDLPEQVYGGQDRERICTALVLLAKGTWDGFEKALDIARTDWRDLLVWSGLGQPDWPQRLDEALRG